MCPSLLALLLILPTAEPPTPTPPPEPAALKVHDAVPKPEMEPRDVVLTVLEALRLNDQPRKDAGITTTFRFASPENQKVTGPIEHFTQIVKHPSYRPMLNHKAANLDPTRRVGDRAFLHARLTTSEGMVVEYDFLLSKDPKSQCWLTDGVMPSPPPAPPLPNAEVI